MSKFEFKTEHEVGNEIFDGAHKIVMNSFNDFLVTIEMDVPYDKKLEAYRNLIDKFKYHLIKEEEFLEFMNYSNSEFVKVILNNPFRKDLDRLRIALTPDRMERCIDMFKEKLMFHINSHKSYTKFIKKK
ncbi:MAG: hypothetical protein PHS92_04535 [Candidatus Gracilibacteria bacterium]|nr:hypothetical protein [Candidatus Gracilibacteria bacterium]